MVYQADVVASDPSGSSVLVVEAKRGGRADPHWAAHFRQNLVVHGPLPGHAYFLLALPHRFFLWEPDQAGDPRSLPRCEVDPTALLAPYFKRAEIAPEDVSEHSFEAVIAAWLNDLARGAAEPTPESAWLQSSGLAERVRGATVSTEAAA